jgi:hypothetical protein
MIKINSILKIGHDLSLITSKDTAQVDRRALILGQNARVHDLNALLRSAQSPRRHVFVRGGSGGGSSRRIQIAQFGEKSLALTATFQRVYDRSGSHFLISTRFFS